MNSPAITSILLAPDANELRPVYRMPAVRRLVILLRRAGIQRIHLVGATDTLVPVLADLLPAEAFHQAESRFPAIEWLLEAVGPPNDLFLALRADLVVDEDSVLRLLTAAGTHRCVYMPSKGGTLSDGLYLTGAAGLASILNLLRSAEPLSRGLPPDIPVIYGRDGLPCRAGKDARGKNPSEARLLRSLALKTAADDGFMARHVDRRISRFFSSRLARSAAKPNQITLAGMTIGLLGAFFLSLPGYGFRLTGALLFLFCVIIDGVDGEVARLKLMETDFGHKLDIITDNIVHVAVFAGIALGLYNRSADPFYLLALLVLVVGFALCAVTVYYCILKQKTEAAGRSSLRLRVMALLSNRDFAYLVVLFAAVDRMGWFLVATAAGTYFFALLLWVFHFLERRPAADRTV